VISEEPSVLEDVEVPVLVLYEEDMGATAEEDERRVDVLDNVELLIFNFDLGNVPRKEVYCH
jgi:hypothetical protein